MLRINILVALAAILIHGGAAFCATSFLSCPINDPSGWKQRQQSHPRLSGMADGDSDGAVNKILNELAAINGRLDSELATINGQLNTINGRLDSVDGRLDSVDGQLNTIKETMKSLDLRTGHLVEGMVTSNLKSKKYLVRDAYDIVELISPQADRSAQKFQADRINDHLFQNCTRDLLNEIVGKEIPYEKYMVKWTDEDVLNANSLLDEKINDNHKRSGNFRWSWERAAYQQLHARKDSFRDNSLKWIIIRQFMRVIEAGFPDNTWKTKKPIFIANEEHDEFNYKDAEKVFLSNREGLLPSLMFADSVLKDWNYKGDNNWAMSHIDIDGIRHDYAKDHSTIVSIIEVKSSMAGKDKANNQLLFRAHMLDEYARIAWDGSEDKTTLSLNLEAHFFDSNNEGCLPQNHIDQLDKDDFKIAYPVWMYKYYDVK